MNKNIFKVLLLSTFLFLPILGMKKQLKERCQQEDKIGAAQYLDYISQAMFDAEIFNNSPRGMQELVLHLETFKKKKEEIKKWLSFDVVITAVANIFNERIEPKALAHIIKNNATSTISTGLRAHRKKTVSIQKNWVGKK